MTHYFNECADDVEPFATMYPEDNDARKDWIKSLHLRKTDLFLDVVQAGKLPLRPGVRRLVREALENGARVAVCSTSNEKAVKGIVATMLPEYADQIPVFAGDVVPKKKPAPDIYNLAATTLVRRMAKGRIGEKGFSCLFRCFPPDLLHITHYTRPNLSTPPTRVFWFFVMNI